MKLVVSCLVNYRRLFCLNGLPACLFVGLGLVIYYAGRRGTSVGVCAGGRVKGVPCWGGSGVAHNNPGLLTFVLALERSVMSDLFEQ